MRPCENPFRVERLQGLPFRFGDASLEELLGTLKARQYQGAIVGPHGHGKSTLLELLRQELNAQGQVTSFLQLTESTQRTQSVLLRNWLALAVEETILMLDGAERLSWWNWRKLKSVRKRGLILTTHRPGYLETLYECRTSPELLEDLVEELTLGVPGVVTRNLRQLYSACNGNVRECLRTLYDDAATARGLGQNKARSQERVSPLPPRPRE